MKKYATTFILLGIILVLAVVLAGVLLYLKNQPPQQRAFQPVTTVKPLEPDSAIWGLNYPNEYSSLLQTANNTTSTKYGGSAGALLPEPGPAPGDPVRRLFLQQGVQPAARPPGHPDRCARHPACHRHHPRHLLFLQILR